MGNKRADTDSDLRPDSWSRFERAVDAAVKSGPKHQKGSSPSKTGQPQFDGDVDRVAKSPPQHRTSAPSAKGLSSRRETKPKD
jgi:hypothetical protein